MRADRRRLLQGAVLALAASRSAAAAGGELRLVRSGDIGALLAVPAVLGARRGWWLVDSGASSALVSPAVARELDLPVVGRSRIATVGGVTSVDRVALPALEVLGDAIGGAQALALDLASAFAGLGLAFDGVLAAAQLRPRRLHLDLARGTASWISDAAVPGTGVPIRWDSGLPTVELRLGNLAPERFLLDTGNAGGLVVFAHRASALLAANPGLPGSRADELGGTVRAQHALVDRVEIGGHRFGRVPAALETAMAGRRGGIFDRLSGSLGVALFDGLRLTLDGPGSTWAIDGLGDGRPREVSGGFGLGVAAQGADLEVRQVIEGSPAHAAAVRPGDRILAADGQPTAGWSAPMLWTHAHGRERLTLALRTGDAPPREVALARASFLPVLSL